MVRQQGFRGFRAVVISLGLGAAFLLPGLVQPVAAYSGWNAASWADSHWNSATSAPPSPYSWNTGGSDCATFVSIAMRVGGGFRPVNNSYVADRWYFNSWASLTPSWINTWDLYNFLMVDWPGGSTYAVTPGNVAAPYNNLAVGDLVFFNWHGTGPGGITHVAMEAGWGSWQDSRWGGYHTGDYIDQHTNDRLHQAWNGYYWNDYRDSTTVFSIHIDPSM